MIQESRNEGNQSGDTCKMMMRSLVLLLLLFSCYTMMRSLVWGLVVPKLYIYVMLSHFQRKNNIILLDLFFLFQFY